MKKIYIVGRHIGSFDLKIKDQYFNTHTSLFEDFKARVEARNFTEGCYGFLAAFTNKRKAEKFAAGKYPIIEMEEIKR